MKTKDEIIAILRNFKEEFGERYGIEKLGLFGSVARGEQKEDSDIDIYYESSHMSLFTLCRLKSELEKLLGCSVDYLLFGKQCLTISQEQADSIKVLIETFTK